MRTPEEVAREAARAPQIEPDCPTAVHPTTLDEVLPCPECDVLHGARVIAAYAEEIAAAADRRQQEQQERIQSERDDYRDTARALRGLNRAPAAPECVAVLHDKYADALDGLLSAVGE